MIHPLACVHPSAVIAESAQIGPFAYIEENVVIGERTVVMANASVMSGARIGDDCQIFPSAVVGAIPQDLKFRGEDTLAIIGNNTVIRECATVHRGTASKGKTVVGNNATQLAGEVVVDEYAILGGGSLVHQFTHVGAHSMTQGGTKVNKDIPPYVIAAREPVSFCGINAVGLSRRGFTKEQVTAIQDTYRLIYMSGLNVSQALQQINETLPQSPERDAIINFITTSPRGVIRGTM